MNYEAHWSSRKHWALAVCCILLSSLGFVAAGVIPTASGAYPLIGWPIVAATLGGAWLCVRRALNREPLVRVDDAGLFVKAVAPQPIPWSEVVGVQILSAGRPQVTRIKLRDPAAIPGARGLSSLMAKADRLVSYGHFGINSTAFDHGQDELVAAIRSHIPQAAG